MYTFFEIKWLLTIDEASLHVCHVSRVELVCFFFLDLCRCFVLSLEEEEDERLREELEVEECFLFLCDSFFFPLEYLWWK